ncbi:MAG TPA: GSCFA domain-containing protein, partial [Thermoanaerobaculia bacterium]
MRLAKAVFRALPRSVQRRLHDRVEDWRRYRPAPHRGLEEFALTPAQVYPRGVNFDDCVRQAIARGLEELVIQKETPVASIGSCFSDELASFMRGAGFNYVAAESHVFPASANWGRVYTIPALRQVILYSTQDDFPIPIEHSIEGWFDPLREPLVGHYPGYEQAEEAIHGHRAASRKAFATARVLIITLGQNEGWIDRRSGVVWARRPPEELLQTDAGRFEVRTFSFEENVEWLRDALERLRELNEDIDVLLTVSP